MNEQQAETSGDNPAPFGRRVIALFVDLKFVTVLASIPSALLLNSLFNSVLNGDAQFNYRTFFVWFLLTILGCGGLFLLRDSINGISPGKMLVAIQTRKDTGKMTIGASILRNLPLLIWPVELLLFNNQTNKRWGDRLAGTSVVSDKKKRGLIRFYSLAVIALGFSFFVVGAQSMMNDHPAYPIAKSAVMSDTAILQIVGDTPDLSVSNIKSSIEGDVLKAVFQFTVKGSKGKASATVWLNKVRDGDWEVIEVSTQ